MLSKPKFKIARRLGREIFDKTSGPKFSSASGKFGDRGGRPKALSEYGTQMLEKQKVRFSYGITERQLGNYVEKASHAKGAGAVDKFYELLEMRLDNVVYRMGLAPSRRGARQMVSHGHFLVNGKKVTIPSYEVKAGDIVKIREGSRVKKLFTNLPEKFKDYILPTWVSFDADKMEGKIIDKPQNNQTFLDLNVVLEFYSR
jgi:small subunit ribosomal protein S4